MRNKRVPLPSHMSEFENVFRAASPVAIEGVIARMREKIPEELRQPALPPGALRHSERRKEDLRRAGVPTGVAGRFADAEARLRIQIALVARDASLIEWSVSCVEPLPNGGLTLTLDTPAPHRMSAQFSFAFGADVSAAGR